jgi:hypothetical protein
VPRGDFVPLGNVGKETKQLYNAFVGVVSKSLDTQRLASKLASRIRAQAHRQKGDLISDLLSDLTAEGVQHTQVSPADIYTPNEQSTDNVKHWAAASTIKDAKGKVGKVRRGVLAARGILTYVGRSRETVSNRSTAVRTRSTRYRTRELLLHVKTSVLFSSIYTSWLKLPLG